MRERRLPNTPTILTRPVSISSERSAATLNGDKAHPAADATSFGTVALAIPTCQRPQNLTELLASVQRLEREGMDLQILVVDNDVTQSAKPVVANAMQGSTIPVTYDCIPERNLPLVRNRLVELASDLKADWIWFLDDDTIVEPDALRLMLSAATTYQADCVIARVPHIFGQSTHPWAQWSGLFDDLERPTGRSTNNFGTSAALLRLAAVSQVSEPFDVRLGLTGGSDGLFFARFHSLGFKTVGCNEAVIHDRLHASRNNPRWLTQRAFRIGNVKGIIVKEVRPSFAKSGKWLVLGVGYAVLNFLIAVAVFPLGRSHYFRYWIRAIRGCGIAVGVLLGRKSLRGQEYAIIHGE